ncbi:MAG: phage portal protein [Chloroflexi bacterium]|nr:phage portal protein [Chloroflexota bacterium]
MRRLLKRLTGRTERRARPYTDDQLEAQIAHATGVIRATATATVETAAGMVGRAFAAAEVDGDLGALTPSVRESMGRGFVLRGEALFALDVAGVGVVLLPATSALIEGGPIPATWQYRSLMLPGPTRTISETRTAPAVFHVRVNADPRRPWEGVSPVEASPATAGLLARIDRHHAHGFDTLPRVVINASPDVGPSGTTIPRQDGDLDRIAERYLVSRQGAPGVDAPPYGSPVVVSGVSVDYVTHDVDGGTGPLRETVERSILAACGIPPELAHGNADGGAAREALRRFMVLTLQPWARLIEAEGRAKLESDVRIDLRPIRAADITGRARAYGSLVNAGMDEGEAADAVGLED